MIIEVTGDEGKISSFYDLLKGFGVQEMMRTGRVAMIRGNAATGGSENARRRNGSGVTRRYSDYEQIL